MAVSNFGLNELDCKEGELALKARLQRVSDDVLRVVADCRVYARSPFKVLTLPSLSHNLFIKESRGFVVRLERAGPGSG